MKKIKYKRFSLHPKVTCYVEMDTLTQAEKDEIAQCLLDLNGGDTESCYNCCDVKSLTLDLAGADEDFATAFLREVCRMALKNRFTDLVFDFD